MCLPYYSEKYLTPFTNHLTNLISKNLFVIGSPEMWSTQILILWRQKSGSLRKNQQTLETLISKSTEFTQ